MSDPPTFGGSSAYYDQRYVAPKRSLNTPESQIAELLSRYDPDLQSRVERTFKQWNGILRDYIRSATGLRLTVGEEQQVVPVRVVAGLPGPLAELINRIDPLYWELLYNRSVFEQTSRGLEIVLKRYTPLTETYLKPSPATPSEVANTHSMIAMLLKVVGEGGLQEEFKLAGRDIFGAYYYRIPEVHLYWMSIGLMAGVLGVPVESLTLVVLTHELAHAYTHAGRDTDGERWDTEAFAASDLCIVEGLAQFYTSAICEKLDPRMPTVKAAFEALMKYQDKPYTDHLTWFETQRGAGEVVRGAMIECRSNGITNYGEFRDIIERFKSQIPKHAGAKSK